LESIPVHPSWQEALSGPRIQSATFQRINSGDRWDPGYLITLVEIGWNSGFAHANNVGAKMALGVSDVSHIWLLNNDTIVQPDTLAELKATASREANYAIIGATLVYYRHEDMVQGVGASFNRLTAQTKLIGNRNSCLELESQADVERKIDFVIGASMFVSRDFIDSSGLMDERYFLYFEELDWAHSMRSPNKLGWSPKSIVYHKEGSSIGSDSLNQSSTVSVFYLNRGLVIFYSKWYPFLLPLALMKIAFSIFRFFCRLDWARAQAARRGAASGLMTIIRKPMNNGGNKTPPHLI
jgi:GT2 family glycosyltransferase